MTEYLKVSFKGFDRQECYFSVVSKVLRLSMTLTLLQGHIGLADDNFKASNRHARLNSVSHDLDFFVTILFSFFLSLSFFFLCLFLTNYNSCFQSSVVVAVVVSLSR